MPRSMSIRFVSNLLLGFKLFRDICTEGTQHQSHALSVLIDSSAILCQDSRHSKMFRNLLESLKPKPKAKFSLENLQYLYEQLVKNPTINEQNKALIVETLRQIAELLIWGDQHSQDYFDFFLEHNIMGYFLKILDQTTNHEVQIQLIQTLSILIENINNTNSIYFILSNNHLNELITHKYDFSDDELLAYYISLLKTLSLKLNVSTLQFFYNDKNNDFPLYTEAIKFFNHKEAMIRIAVRTLSLNVYKVKDENMRNFIFDSAAAPYFSNIVWYIREQCTTLDNYVVNSTFSNKNRLEDFVAELMDFFWYLQDIFDLGIPQMSEVLSDHLLKYLILPQFIGSLPINGKIESNLEDQLSPVCSIFLLTQVFHIFTYSPMLNAVAAAIIHPSSETYGTSPTRAISVTPVKRTYSSPDLYKGNPEAENRTEAETTEENVPKGEKTEVTLERGTDILADGRPKNKYYQVLMGYLNGEERTALNVICLLYSITKSNNIDNILLEYSGLFPYRLYKAKRLLEALIFADSEHFDKEPEEEGATSKSAVVRRSGRSGVKGNSHSRSVSDGAVVFSSENRENTTSALNPTEAIEEAASSTSNGTDGHVTSEDKNKRKDSHNMRKTVLEKNLFDEKEEERKPNQESASVKLVEHLLTFLLACGEYRLITLQMVTLLIKELVYVQDTAPNMKPKQLELMKTAYEKVVQTLYESMQGNLGNNIFLELFEDQLKTYKQINFDSLLMDCATLLLPVAHTPVAGIGLSKRLPSGEAERMQKNIQSFLAIREFYYTMLNQKDDAIPLKELPSAQVKLKEVIGLEGRDFIPCAMAVGANKKKVRRWLVMEAASLLILEPTPTPTPGTPSSNDAGRGRRYFGSVTHILPMQSIEMQADPNDPASLNLACHPQTFSSSISFENTDHCKISLTKLDKAKHKVRSMKMKQLETILKIE
ncbi:hypothetical protein PROFUN_11177 [Planoprotostelium fungivorum]|uniref:Uncharacterized protein n=1 Tax=Planoprotostelium fungivorum TaxID=1890364 RepID=A0A2P6NAP4_9EUKA|nr:hypothetical protein PROFUN_11177 [Planoprotostelium fungivorum]